MIQYLNPFLHTFPQFSCYKICSHQTQPTYHPMNYHCLRVFVYSILVFYSINKLFNLIHLPFYLPIYQQTSQNWSLDTSSKELITKEACGVLNSKLSSISIRPYNTGLAENTITSPRVEISYLDYANTTTDTHYTYNVIAQIFGISGD